MKLLTKTWLEFQRVDNDKKPINPPLANAFFRGWHSRRVHTLLGRRAIRRFSHRRLLARRRTAQEKLFRDRWRARSGGWSAAKSAHGRPALRWLARRRAFRRFGAGGTGLRSRACVSLSSSHSAAGRPEARLLYWEG